MGRKRASAGERPREGGGPSPPRPPRCHPRGTGVERAPPQCVNQHFSTSPSLLHLLLRMSESFSVCEATRPREQRQRRREGRIAALRILGGAARGRTLFISGHNSICNYKCRRRTRTAAMGSPARRPDNTRRPRRRRLLRVATSCCCLILAIQLTTTPTAAAAVPARKQMVRKCERASERPYRARACVRPPTIELKALEQLTSITAS